ncbi:nucleolar protein 58-like isoform X2 [Paramormyrops kingsleyae]|uniref:nucleolar protein 58-like isoform X2 n=1 Tax=Paramormyrops kingsleyae TaxID=1676925 RepID=UPI003B97A98E
MKRSPSAMPVSDAKLGGVISFNLNCFHGPAVAELLRGIRSLMEARSTGPPQWEAAVMSLGLTHSPDKVDIMIVQAICSRKKKLEKLEEGEEKEKEKSPITKAKKSFPEFH